MTQNILEMRDIDKGLQRRARPQACQPDVRSEVHAPSVVKTVPQVHPHEGSLRRHHGQYDGAIIFDGKEVQFRPLLTEALIGIIHQELASFPTCRSQKTSS